MAEYNPISIFLKNNTFSPIIITSTATIILLVLIYGLYAFAIHVIKSVPPVDAFAFKTNANPNPIKIPPYIHAKNLSFVRGGTFSNISINIESNVVPKIDFIINFFPILKNAHIKKGTFKAKITVPNGNLNK